MKLSKHLMIACAAAALAAPVGMTALQPQAFAGEKAEAASTSETAAKTNIVEAAVATESLSTLVAAVKAASLVETLSGEGPFTVFAPTNDAFAALPDGTLDTLLKPENKDTLTGILTYHVVATKALSGAVTKMAKDGGGEVKLDTVNGGQITVMLKDDKLMLQDVAGNTANVIAADLEQSNGVVHVIDTVLMPTKS